MYTLIITVMLYGNSVHTATVPAFENEAACVAAGNAYQRAVQAERVRNNTPTPYATTITTCARMN